MFGRDDEQTERESDKAAPRPFRLAAVERADQAFRSEYPGIDRRQLTMEWEDEGHRRAWMAHYRWALDDLGIPPATSHPDREVGDCVASAPTPSTGNLTVVSVDASSDQPIGGASVRVWGPTVNQGLSGYWGEARFENIAVGEYEVYAIDFQHRSGQGRVTVTRGETELRLACRQLG